MVGVAAKVAASSGPFLQRHLLFVSTKAADRNDEAFETLFPGDPDSLPPTRCFQKLDYCGGGKNALHCFFGVISTVGNTRPSGEQINREHKICERKKGIVGEGDAKGGMCEVILSSSKIPDKRSHGLFPLCPKSCLMGVTKGSLTLIMKGGGDSPQKMDGDG